MSLLQLQPLKLVAWLILVVLLASTVDGKQCIKTKVGQSCTDDHDCYGQNELHLYCNKTVGVNVCAFHHETYIGHVAQNVDCEGKEFSSEPWSNPVPEGLIEVGIDCMRMCLHVQTCFGITIYNSMCFLKNEKCFENLKPRDGALAGVLNVVREDYKCGCHYPFTRKTSDGQMLTWNPECPENQLSRNPFRCCSERGLCVECNSQSGNSNQDDEYLRNFFSRTRMK